MKHVNEISALEIMLFMFDLFVYEEKIEKTV